MSAEDSIKILQGRAGKGELDALEWKRVAARVAWVRETVAALRAAQQKVNDGWDRMLDALPDDLSDEELEALNLPDPPEQATVDALHAQLQAVIKKDQWPRELHWCL